MSVIQISLDRVNVNKILFSENQGELDCLGSLFFDALVCSIE